MKFRRKTTDKDGAKPHSKAFRFLRGVIVLLLIAALALAAFWFAVPRYIERRIQGALGEGLTSQLGVDTSVAHVDVDLPGRTVTVYGFRLQQPGGFGSGSMLYLPELRVKVDTAGLISGDYRIEEVDMHRGEINLKTLTNAISNVDALIASVKRQKKESLEEPAEPWSLHIDSLGVYDWAINYHELTEKLRLIEFGVGSVNGELANFRSGALPVAGLREPAHLSLQGQIMNCPYSRGRCGIVGVFSPLTNAPPAFNMWAQFVGFELALIEPALPDNTAALLGGDALDGSLRIQSDSSFVEGKATVKMVAGHEYSVRIMGEAADPKFSLKEDALWVVLNRSRGGLGGLAGNIGRAGGSALKGAADVATGVAKDTAKTVGSFGSGLLNTAKGIVTIDGSDIGSGAKEMGVALTGGAKDAVFTAGGEIMEGAGEITGSLTGSKRAIEWRKEIPGRWKEQWEEARQWVREQPFPPKIAVVSESSDKKEAQSKTSDRTDTGQTAKTSAEETENNED